MKARACPRRRSQSGIVMTGAMLGFPGEDYTTPQTIKETGGFGNPALAAERIERLKWAIDRTMALGLSDLIAARGLLAGAGRARAGQRFSTRWPRPASWPRPGASRWPSRPARRPPTCSV